MARGQGLRIAIVTDAWTPQVNGVVRTLQSTIAQLESRGHHVEVIAPDSWRSWPCPTYPEIRLAFPGWRAVGARIEAFGAQAVHIATEGPLGLAARTFCARAGLSFTSAYHTRFPEYLARRTRLPAALFRPYIRWFHSRSARVMVATESLRQELEALGLNRLAHWSRGVELTEFSPAIAPPDAFLPLPRPIQLYVGRVAVEKNIEAFLENPHPGTRVVVGDGPALSSLRRKYPDALFLGKQSGRALAACYAGADVFVFPSRTDTFGLVMIEALACGTPVAAYPVAGPADVLEPDCGAMRSDLAQAIEEALALDPQACVDHAARFTWQRSADQFLAALVDTHAPPAAQVTPAGVPSAALP